LEIEFSSRYEYPPGLEKDKRAVYILQYFPIYSHIFFKDKNEVEAGGYFLGFAGPNL
jgi:hypothetical protein